MLIGGWDAAGLRRDMVPLRRGMRVGHNFDLGSFVVVDADARTGLVAVQRTDDEGIFPTRRPIEQPLVVYHIEALNER